MRRRLFTMLTPLSLLLCAAAVALWVWSYYRGDYVSMWVRGTMWHVGADSGRLVIEIVGVNPGWGTPEERKMAREQAIAAGVRLSFELRERRTWFPDGPGNAGFGYADDYGLGTRWQTLTAPLWSIAALCGIVTTVGTVPRLRAAVRRRRGTCHACGYDLRATPERCPECGRSVAATP